MTSEKAPQLGAAQDPVREAAPQQQMAAEPAPRPKAKGYAPAFGDGSGAAWVFRDLASI